MGKIAVIGRAAIEIVLSAPSFSCGGEIQGTDRYETRPGGRGGIAAYCARLFGTSAAICTRVGRDGNGVRLRNFLFENGVNTGFMFTDASGQTALDVYLKEGDTKVLSKVYYDGATPLLSDAEIDKAAVEGFDALLLQCEIGNEISVHAAEAFRKKEAAVIADMTASSDLSILPALGDLAVLIMTEKTLAPLSMPLSSMEECLKCCMEISRRVKASYYLIVLEGRGIFVYDGKFYKLIFPAEAVTVKKSVYADVLAATLAAVFVRDRDISAAAEAASIADKMAKECANVFVPSASDIVRYASEKTLNLKYFKEV